MSDDIGALSVDLSPGVSVAHPVPDMPTAPASLFQQCLGVVAPMVSRNLGLGLCDWLPHDVLAQLWRYMLGNDLLNPQVLQVFRAVVEEIDGTRCVCLTDSWLVELSMFKSLSRVSLTNCTHLSDVSLAHLASLPTLVDLVLDATPAGSATLAALGTQPVPVLARLSLAGCSNVTDACVVNLRSVSSLIRLVLDRTPVSFVGLSAMLPGLPRLEQLSLAGASVRSLSWLEHVCSPLQALSLDRTDFPHSDMRHIARVAPTLRWLSMAKASISDASMPVLASLSALECLDLTQTDISPDALQHLAALHHLTFLGLYNVAISLGDLPGVLAARFKRGQLQVARRGTLQEQVAALQHYTEPNAVWDDDVVLAIVESLRELVADSVHKAEMSALDGVSCILRLVRLIAPDSMASLARKQDLILRGALATLWSLTVLEENRVSVINGGGVTDVLKIMASTGVSRRVLRNATGLMWNLSVTPASQAQFTTGGGVHLLLHLMNSFADFPPILVTCTAVLWNLSLHEHRDVLHRVGCLPFILSVLSRAAGERELTLNCSAILWNLTSDQVARSSIASLNGLALLLDVLRRWSGDDEIQIKACGALMLCALESNNRQVMVAAGAVRSVLAVLRRAGDNEQLAWHAMGVLRNLSLDPVIQDDIASAGGMADVLALIHAYPTRARLMVRALRVLSNLTLSDSCHALLLSLDGLSRVCLLVRDLITCADAVAEASTIWWNLASVPATRAVLPVELVDHIMLVVGSYSHDPAILHSLLHVMLDLARSPAFATPLRRAGVSAALAGLVEHPEDASVIGKAAALLSKIVAVFPDLVHSILASGVLPRLFGAIIAHADPDAPSVLRFVLDLLAALADADPAARAAVVGAVTNWLSVPDLVYTAYCGILQLCTASALIRSALANAAPLRARLSALLADTAAAAPRQTALPDTMDPVHGQGCASNTAARLCDAIAALRAPDLMQLLASSGLPECRNPLVRAAAVHPDRSVHQTSLLAASTGNVHALQLSAAELHLRSRSSLFESCRLAAHGVSSGRWAYRVRLVTAAVVQLGIARSDCVFDAHEGEGVGDCANSWSYDGARQRSWHTGDQAYGDAWAIGDWITVVVDADAGTLAYRRNDTDLGIAFDNINASSAHPVYPAMSFGPFQQIQVQLAEDGTNDADLAWLPHGCQPWPMSPESV